MVWGASAGGLLSGVGSMIAGNENRKQQQRQNQILEQRLEEIRNYYISASEQMFGGDPLNPEAGIYGQAFKRLQGAKDPINTGYADAVRSFSEGLRQQMQGFDTAREEVQQVGRTAGTQIQRQGRQQADTERARRGAMGLMSSAEAGRGAAYDTQMALGRLGEGLAGMRADIATGRGQAAMQGGAGLADLATGRAGALSGIDASLAGLLQDRANARGSQLSQLSAAIRGMPMPQPVTSSNAILGASLVNALSGGISLYGQFGGGGGGGNQDPPQFTSNEWAAGQMGAKHAQQIAQNAALNAMGWGG